MRVNRTVEQVYSWTKGRAEETTREVLGFGLARTGTLEWIESVSRHSLLPDTVWIDARDRLGLVCWHRRRRWNRHSSLDVEWKSPFFCS